MENNIIDILEAQLVTRDNQSKQQIFCLGSLSRLNKIYEDDNYDLSDTEVNIGMSDINELLPLETEDSVQYVKIIEIYKIR